MPGKKKKAAPVKSPAKKTGPGKPAPAKAKPAPKASIEASRQYSEREVELRRILIKKRRALIENTEEEVSRYIKGESRQLVESTLDAGDTSVIDLSEDLRIQKLGANQDTLNKIDEALRKLDAGTYGMCDDCDDEISAGRLELLPFAIRCRDCQEDYEELIAVEKGESIIY